MLLNSSIYKTIHTKKTQEEDCKKNVFKTLSQIQFQCLIDFLKNWF
jgi:hypothetical protein